MFRSIFLGLAFVGLGLGPIGAESLAANSPQDDIKAVIDAQEKAWNNGDIDNFMKGYWHSDRTTFVGGGDVTRGWDTVRQRYKTKYPDREHMGTLSFSEMEVTMLAPDAALVSGRWQLDFAHNQVHGRTTLIFRKTPDGWRIIHDHSCAATPP